MTDTPAQIENRIQLWRGLIAAGFTADDGAGPDAGNLLDSLTDDVIALTRMEDPDTAALQLERDDWEASARLAGAKLQEAVSRSVQANVDQLRQATELHDLKTKIAAIAQRHDGNRYAGGYDSKLPTAAELSGQIADDLRGLIR